MIIGLFLLYSLLFYGSLGILSIKWQGTPNHYRQYSNPPLLRWAMVFVGGSTIHSHKIIHIKYSMEFNMMSVLFNNTSIGICGDDVLVCFILNNNALCSRFNPIAS